jgi:hypothetical protein
VETSSDFGWHTIFDLEVPATWLLSHQEEYGDLTHTEKQESVTGRRGSLDRKELVRGC